ncbi:uncharacterized protein LOC129303179 [Prosopis cineraria]|uniref:uncharacterized protein LOC129303179 n=1 Tax=Prosopis cineraria TaxID=364024 RepID=UPI002410042A|nr:uncharacterized protein LOC129303179 [Prosopis cineraria]
MGKFWIEVCLISARGLQRSVSLWKRHWYAVGWVDPKSKFCTKIDASGNANPVWRTKFSFLLDDDSEQSLQDLVLNVQVFSRDPIFLTEKLQGSATIMLKEFIAKHVKNSETTRSAGNEELGSYQLRKKKSSKPRGFIDISIRISDDKEEPNMFQGNEGGIFLLDPGRNTNMTPPGGLEQPHRQQQVPLATIHRPENLQQPSMSSYPKPHPSNYPNPYVGGPSYYAPAGPSYQPPPPSQVGYNPTMFPGTEFINMPSSSGAGPAAQRGGVPAGFAIGAGAGALAAGAVMFGGDFMPAAHNLPHGLGDASVTIATDPLF